MTLSIKKAPLSRRGLSVEFGRNTCPAMTVKDVLSSVSLL